MHSLRDELGDPQIRRRTKRNRGYYALLTPKTEVEDLRRANRILSWFAVAVIIAALAFCATISMNLGARP